MVRKTFSVITAKVSGLEKAAFWLALFSALSLVLGFLRDRILAHYFGAGTLLDIYYASFEVPDILFATVASLASASILVPMFSERKENPSALRKFINEIFTSFSLLLFFSCIVSFIFMPYFINLFFSGFEAENISKIIYFSRLLILSPLFLGLSNFFGSIVQYERRFLLYSLSPLFYNAGIIGGLLIGVSKFGIISAVYGVILGAFLHMVVQAIFVFSTEESPRYRLNFFSTDVKKAFRLSIPRTVSLSASGFVGFFFVLLASRLSQGSIAVFTLGFNLQSVLLSLIGVSYSLAAFPTLAEHYVKKEISLLVSCLGRGLRHIVFWAIPASVLFIVLRAHIVRTVLGSGAFSWSDTRMTAAVFGVFALSIVFQSIQLFLTRAHYAFGRTKLPLFINMACATITVLLAVVFFRNDMLFSNLILPVANMFKVSDLARLPVIALPVSFSLGSILSALLLFAFLPKDIKEGLWSSISSAVADAFISSSALVVAVVVGLRIFDDFFVLNTSINVFLHGFLSGICGILVWILVLFLIKNQEFKEVTDKNI